MKTTFLSLGLIATLLTSFASANTEKKNDVRENPLVSSKGLESTLRNSRFKHASFRAIEKGETVSFGSRGPTIKVVQQALLDMGFALPAGADGEFGAQTVLALKAFQTSRGLETSGEINKATMRSLKKVAPVPGKKIWEDERSLRLGAQPMPEIDGK